MPKRKRRTEKQPEPVPAANVAFGIISVFYFMMDYVETRLGMESCGSMGFASIHYTERLELSAHC